MTQHTHTCIQMNYTTGQMNTPHREKESIPNEQWPVATNVYVWTVCSPLNWEMPH